MIFVGDIASPNNETSLLLASALRENDFIFSGKKIVCNFEGLVFNGPQPDRNEPVLYNHPSVINVLKTGTMPVLCLANNHILDLPDLFESSLKLFQNEGIISVGAGKSEEEASKPVVFFDGIQRIYLYNACWSFLLYNHRNPTLGIYVSEIDEKKLINKIISQKDIEPDARHVVFLHWNFDLEIIPFPMYRQFSRALIDAGADIVIGTHSHCVQGGEKFKNGFIIYGLGNFFLPHYTFANRFLAFPDFAKIQLAFEWDSYSRKVMCHWFEYTFQGGKHLLKHISSDDFESSELLKNYSPYLNLNEKEYIEYFKEHRRKKFLIPIFVDYNDSFRNGLLTFMLKNRAHIARFLAKKGIVKWQN